MIPIVIFPVGDFDVGDLEYIQGKVTGGNYFQVSGAINAINDTIEYVPANGKTAFMIEAKIVITGHINPPTLVSNASPTNTITNNRVQAQFKVDTVVKDTANVGFVMNATGAVFSALGGAGTGSGDYKCNFNVQGLSLVGDGAKKIEIKNSLDNGTAFATMSGYLITT